MASPRQSDRTASTNNNSRTSLCQFTFSDGRKCRTPRTANHPYFCFSHARKESQAFAAAKLGDDMAHFFSGHYLSANDLSAALGCLFPAVIRGDIKPRCARTVTYLAQTLVQSIHLAQNEYINTFGREAWRDNIVTSNNSNYDRINDSSPDPDTPPDSATQSEPTAFAEGNPGNEPRDPAALPELSEEEETPETSPLKIQ